MSEEAKQLIFKILQEISGCRYLYRYIVAGSLEACLLNYGMKKPLESNDEIIDEVFRILNQEELQEELQGE